jgi:hypothetical protein
MNYTIFADYYQVYLVDESLEWYHPEMWYEAIYDNERVAVARGVIGISTVRNLDVPVDVEIHQSEPKEALVRVKPNNQHPGVLCERRHIAPLTGCGV